MKNSSDFKISYRLAIVRLCALTFLVVAIANLSLRSERQHQARRHRRVRSTRETKSDLESGQFGNRTQVYSEQDAWSEIKTSYKVSLCPSEPRFIRSRIQVETPPRDFNATNNYTTEFNFTRHLKPGGYYKPLDCTARHRLLIIIPYKNRLSNLNYFLYHMHSLLQRQELEYRIVVVEQFNDALFNKGVLMNGAFLEMMGLRETVRGERNLSEALGVSNFDELPFDCATFHDVDLLPEDDR
jgi:hypothetical protein